MDDSDGSDIPSEGVAPLTCARCARAPRNDEDRLSWATIDDDDVCPGCLTLADSDRLRSPER